MDSNLDFLLVEPSLDWEESIKVKKAMRIEEDKPSREGLKISSGYLLSAIKVAGYNVKFIDMTAEKIGIDDLIEYIKKSSPMIVGMSAFTFQIPVVVELFSKIKKNFPNIVLCLGGCHVSSLPKETLKIYPCIDVIVKGEAETILPIIIGRISSGLDVSDVPGVCVKGSDNEIFWEDVSDVSFPAWEEFEVSKYGGSFSHFGKVELPMLTSRGCPFKCIFCCRQSGSKCRRRTVESVIKEIERNIEVFNCDTITFLDETFILDKKWINDFLDHMIISGLNKKIKWYCLTRVNSVSLELLTKMKKAGCYCIFYGFESSNPEVLKIIKKGIAPDQMQNAVRWTKEAGIVPVGAFMIGLPGDTRESILETIEFGTQLGLYSITFPIATPFPGTELRDMAIRGEYGMRIISNDWGGYLANDLEKYGKDNVGHLESDDLSWDERIELQKFAYKKNPKKKLSEYIDSLNKYKGENNNG